MSRASCFEQDEEDIGMRTGSSFLLIIYCSYECMCVGLGNSESVVGRESVLPQLNLHGRNSF